MSFMVYIREPVQNGGSYKGAGYYQSLFDTSSDGQGGKVEIAFESGARLEKGKYYEIVLEVAEPNVILKISGGTWLTFARNLETAFSISTQPVSRLTENTPFEVTFMSLTNGSVYSIQFGHIVDILNLPVDKTISVADH